jgi:hypothetical protein
MPIEKVFFGGIGYRSKYLISRPKKNLSAPFGRWTNLRKKIKKKLS